MFRIHSCEWQGWDPITAGLTQKLAHHLSGSPIQKGVNSGLVLGPEPQCPLVFFPPVTWFPVCEMGWVGPTPGLFLPPALEP